MNQVIGQCKQSASVTKPKARLKPLKASQFTASVKLQQHVRSLEDAIEDAIPEWKIEADGFKQNQLIEKILELRKIMWGLKMVLVIHIEITESKDMLKGVINGLEDFLKEPHQFEAVALYSNTPDGPYLYDPEHELVKLNYQRLKSVTLSKAKTLAEGVLPVIEQITQWVDNKQKYSRDHINVQYLYISDLKMEHGLRKDDSIRVKLSDLEQKLDGFFSGRVMRANQDPEARQNQKQDVIQTLQNYIEEKKPIVESIYCLANTSDEILYSNTIFQHASNVELIAGTVRLMKKVVEKRQYDARLKKMGEIEGFRKASAHLMILYKRLFEEKLGFIEFEEQSFLNQLARHKFAVQQAMLETCDACQEVTTQVLLKRYAYHKKLEGIQLCQEVNKLKAVAIQEMAESKIVIFAY